MLHQSWTFLDNANAMFYLWNMLTFGGQVDSQSTWQCFNHGLDGCKLNVHIHNRSMESLMEIVHVDLLESIEYNFNLPIGQVFSCGEVNDMTQCQEEWNFVHKEQIHCQKHYAIRLGADETACWACLLLLDGRWTSRHHCNTWHYCFLTFLRRRMLVRAFMLNQTSWL